MLLEDFGALIGLVFALLGGVGLAVLTGDGAWDGVGTLAIGVLLAPIALILATETKSLLLGECATPTRSRRSIRAALEADPGHRIIHMRTLHLGPEEFLVAAKIAVEHDDTAGEVARGDRRGRGRIREAVPMARVIYLEPDLYRADAVSEQHADA